MKKFLLGLSVAVAFIVGCTTAVVASNVVVPPARSAEVQKWEYSCQHARENVTAMANSMGAQGWELTASNSDGAGGMVWCFKRPL